MNSPVSSLIAVPSLDASLAAIIEGVFAELQRGAQVDLRQLIADNPQFAERLSELAPTIEALLKFAAASDAPTELLGLSGMHASIQGQTLGDYRILRELGRGGMGAVYEAEQLSMGRRVALKILPFVALADDRALARFRNEVRAAALLDHPHVVSVYSVGEERGVHFYAMQLVHGQTLADVISELRQTRGTASPVMDPTPPERPRRVPASNAEAAPTSRIDQALIRTSIGSRKNRERFRTAARLGIQAAEALQHAHDRGVIHRDVKPSNMLIDGKGELYVADFGLARIEADAGVTMTGDMIGTLRYMAPEQALGERLVVDHRADVYSLGAALYELLTLEPAFGETNRAELIRQIAQAEPRPLRKLNGSIPVDLETIVLKAMAKQRDARYSHAQQLADDLRAFCDCRPIAAQPPTWTDQVRKWSRRNETLVRAAGLAGVLLIVILATSSALLMRANARARVALEETSQTLYAADMALAFDAHEKGWSDEVQAVLTRWRPHDGEPDRRGFEWHLLQALVKPPESITLAGHVGSANELAAFPDGRRLASVGDDGTLRIWDAVERRLLQIIPIENGKLHSVAISPDGKLAAVGSAAVWLCPLDGDAPPKQLYANEYGIESLVFSPDGQQVTAGVRYDHAVALTLDGRVIRKLPSAARIWSLDYLAGTTTLLLPNRLGLQVRDVPGVLQLVSQDLKSVERELSTPTNVNQGVRGPSVARSSPCGRYIAAGEERGSVLRLLDAATGNTLATTRPSRDSLLDVAYSPAGDAVVAAFKNGAVEYFPLQVDERGTPRFLGRPRVIDAHRGEAMSVRFLGRDLIASCGEDGMVRLWRRPTNSGRVIDISDRRLCSAELSQDGSKLFCCTDDEARIIDVASGQVLFTQRQPQSVFHSPAWSADGDRACFKNKLTRAVYVIDSGGQPICSVITHEFSNGTSISPDGSLLAITGGLNPSDLATYDADNGRLRGRLQLDSNQNTLAFSRKGDKLVVGGYGGPVCVLDVESLKVAVKLPCKNKLNCAAFSPDDRMIATGHADGVIRLWNVSDGKWLAELSGHEREVTDLVFSPDGRTILSAGQDGDVRAWSADRLRSYGVTFRRPATSDSDLACLLSLSADGRRLAITFRTVGHDIPDVVLVDLDLAQLAARTAEY